MLNIKDKEGTVDMIWSWGFKSKTLATESLKEDDQELLRKVQFPPWGNHSSF